MPIGPPLPPHLRPQSTEDDDDVGDIGPSLPSHLKKSNSNSIGPALPPNMGSNKDEISISSDEEDIGPKIPPSVGPQRPSVGAKRPSTGPSLPSNSKKPKSDDSDEDFGPALPGPAQKGPQLPAHFREMLAKQNPLYDENVD